MAPEDTRDDRDEARDGATQPDGATQSDEPRSAPRDEPSGASRDATHRTRGTQSGADPGYPREFAEAIGRTIKVIRTDLGIERRELAATVGISYSYLTEIENGNKPASSAVLRPLAHALGLRLSQLTEAAEQRLEARDESLAMSLPMLDFDSTRMEYPPTRDYVSSPSAARLGGVQQSALRPSLRGQYRELREAVLELERLLQRMAPDDIERLLDYARRLSR
jgi:transcriptional regulator with XRE-family HTH domain